MPAVTFKQIEAAAPDQASLNAARKLLKPAKWPELRHDTNMTLLWGACQGSGANPYRVAVDLSDLGAKCSCPSRKFPCKHAIALMWWQADNADRFTAGDIPQWVTEWLGRRRKGGAPKKNDEAKSVAAAAAVEEVKPADPARARKQRARSRAMREKAIRAGLDELDLWLSDQVDRGLSGFGANAIEQCRLIARRLVDAKAGGLATRLDMLATDYFATPEPRRQDLLIETFGSLHLLAEAYRRQARLSAELRADVRRLVGWSQKRDEVLDDADALRAAGTWTVIATLRDVQPDRLVRFETWLLNVDREQNPAAAVLIDFVPVATAAASSPALEPGTTLDAELVFYRSATPLRALIARQTGSDSTNAPPPAVRTLPDALSDYDERVARNPWLPAWPLDCKAVDIRSTGETLWAVDDAAGIGVPIAGDEASVLNGLRRVDLHGAYNGRELLPLAASTPLGAWWSTSP